MAITALYLIVSSHISPDIRWFLKPQTTSTQLPGVESTATSPRTEDPGRDGLDTLWICFSPENSSKFGITSGWDGWLPRFLLDVSLENPCLVKCYLWMYPPLRELRNNHFVWNMIMRIIGFRVAYFGGHPYISYIYINISWIIYVSVFFLVFQEKKGNIWSPCSKRKPLKMRAESE